MKTILRSISLLFFTSILTPLISQEPNCVYMVEDLYPGSYGAYPSLLTPYNGALYFTATGNSLGLELWKYENGVISMAADINPGVGGSLPNQLTVVGPYLYFRAMTAAEGMELFRYDGVSVTCVADIVPGPGSSFVSNLTAVGTDLYFVANDGSTGMEPWKFDGTTATLVADINPGINGSNPTDIEAAGGYVYFAATHPSYGLELWKYDGTTTTVVDIYPGTTGSDIGELTALGGKLCFRATNGVIGYELWTHDGTTLTSLDMNPTADFTPWEFTVAGGVLYFRGFQSATGYELWKYDGTTCSMVMDIRPGTGNSHPNNLVAVGSEIYFAANDGVNGNELWKSDGITATLVADIKPGSSGSMPVPWTEHFASDGTWVFFLANSGSTGDELWKSDGTTTVLGKDIIPGSTSSVPTGMKTFGGKLFFTADNGVNGGELWAWDPNADLSDTITVYTCSAYNSPGGDFYSTPGTYSFTDILSSVNCPGCDSLIHVNLTITDQPESTMSIVACGTFISPGGTTYSVPGDYTIDEVIPSIGCSGMDSLIHIDLTLIDDFNTAVQPFGNVIVALQPGAFYQWLDCDNGYAPIPGATNQDFLPVNDGNYACQISMGSSCTDTSNCHFVTGNGSTGAGFSENETNFVMYPNPASDMVLVSCLGNSGPVAVKLIDGLGNIVLTVNSETSSLSVSTVGIAPGIYFVYMNSGDVHRIKKLIIS